MAKNKDSLASEIVGELKDLESRRKSLELEWIENFKKLWLDRKDLTEAEKDLIEKGITADVRVARLFSHFETKRPRIVNSIFSYDPIMRAKIIAETKIQNLKVLQIVVNKFMSEGLFVPFNHAFTQSLYTSVGWVGFSWDTQKYGDEAIDRINFTHYDTFNVYVPDTALSKGEVNVLYRRILKRRSYLEKHPKTYTNLDKIEKLNETEVNKTKNNTWAERMSVLNLITGKDEEARSYGALKDEDIVEIIERWDKDKVVSVANRKTIIREAEHIYPDIPMYPIRNYPSDTMFYGMDEIKLMADLPEYADEMKNLRLNIERRVAWPAALVSRKAKIRKEDLLPKPHQIIKTYDMDGYREVQRPDVKRILVDEEFISRQDMENVTGLYSYLKGGAAPRAETATTALTMKEAGMERMMSQVFFLNYDFFVPMAKDITSVLQDRMDAGVWINLSQNNSNPDMQRVTKQDIEGYVEWILSAYNIKSVADVNLQQNFLGMYDRMAGSPNVNRYELDKKAFEVFDFKNIDDLMVRGPEALIIDQMRDEDSEFGALLRQAANNPQLGEVLVMLMKAAMQRIQAGGQPGGGQPTEQGPPLSGVGNPAGGAAPMSMGRNQVGTGANLGI